MKKFDKTTGEKNLDAFLIRLGNEFFVKDQELADLVELALNLYDGFDGELDMQLAEWRGGDKGRHIEFIGKPRWFLLSVLVLVVILLVSVESASFNWLCC